MLTISRQPKSRRAAFPLCRRLTPALLGLAACSCGGSPTDAEAELRALVDATAAAAEARDTGFFRDLIADDYADAAGRSRDDLIDRVRGYFFLNTSVEVLTRIERVELLGGDAAELVVQAALVGGRRNGALPDIDADFRRIELELVRDGARWQVIAAAWGRE